jgi:glycosyl hydrolase family 19 (putative chitinase)
VLSRDGGCLTEKCTLRYLQRMAGSAGSFYAKLINPEANGNRYYGRGFIQLTGVDNYKRVADITGEPIYDQPDLLLAPDVSARVLFAWLTDPRLSPNRTLDKFTTAAGFDMEQAARIYIGGPRSRDSPMLRRGLALVKASNDRFAACIAAAKALN